MRVLWITKIYSPTRTGGTKVSFNYLKELEDMSDLQIHALINETTSHKISIIKYYFELIKIRKKNFDLIFFDDHLSWTSIFFKSKKTVLFYHGNWPSLLFTNIIYFIKGMYLFPLYLIGMKFCKLTIFVNPYYERLFSNWSKTHTTLLNPINLNKLVKRSLNRTQEPKKIVLIGNVDNRKYSNFVKFLNWLIKNKKDVKFDFYVFGEILNRSIEAKLLAKGVNIMGYRKNIDYENFQIHISFSKSENLPLSLFEALYCNLKCIYPDEKNYKDFKNKKGVYFYKNFEEAFKYLNEDCSLTETDTGFIPTSFRDNLRSLTNKIKNEI